MKKSTAVLFIASLLLIIWGATDLYNYATTGQELLQHYDGEEIIRELVNYSLIQGLVKSVLGLFAPGLWLFSQKEEKIDVYVRLLSGRTLCLGLLLSNKQYFCHLPKEDFIENKRSEQNSTGINTARGINIISLGFRLRKKPDKTPEEEAAARAFYPDFCLDHCPCHHHVHSARSDDRPHHVPCRHRIRRGI